MAKKKKTYSARYVEGLRSQITNLQESYQEWRMVCKTKIEELGRMEIRLNAAVKSQTAAEAEVVRLEDVVVSLDNDMRQVRLEFEQEIDHGMRLIGERNARDAVIVEQALQLSTFRRQRDHAEQQVSEMNVELRVLEAAAKKKEQADGEDG